MAPLSIRRDASRWEPLVKGLIPGAGKVQLMNSKRALSELDLGVEILAREKQVKGLLRSAWWHFVLIIVRLLWEINGSPSLWGDGLSSLQCFSNYGERRPGTAPLGASTSLRNPLVILCAIVAHYVRWISCRRCWWRVEGSSNSVCISLFRGTAVEFTSFTSFHYYLLSVLMTYFVLNIFYPLSITRKPSESLPCVCGQQTKK